MQTIEQRIAAELGVSSRQVEAAVRLLDEGATVPFIARYRKEATGGLDDAQLRTLQERLRYLRELEERRTTILSSIADQGKLTPELEADIRSAETKVRLEDLYLPYRPKRRTKAQIARESGLEPLAHLLRSQPSLTPFEEASRFIDPEKGVTDAEAALEGARHILMEDMSEDAELAGTLREYVWERAKLRSRVVKGKEEDGAKFADYFDGAEPIRAVPSHRALAVLRGRREGFLRLDLVLEENAAETSDSPRPVESTIARRFGIENRRRPADSWLRETVRQAWESKIFPRIETDLEARLRERAEKVAIQVFASNLRDLLLAAPAGPRPTLGLDPGFRTGVKVAVVNEAGKLVDTATIYPHEPKRQWERSIEILAELVRKHGVELVAIGNGTASRETDRLVADLLEKHTDLRLEKIVVSEAGASVYSASEVASKELPQIDVSLRGAVSISRRLQDPLSELVKIEPKSIGVGQYQHDVDQAHLGRSLDAVVEDCVNAVGVDVNSASAPLLARISGLSPSLAGHIVHYRETEGLFNNRQALLLVPRMGPKTFEQSAGFLRIRGGDNPLDASAVHPEAYPVVARILKTTGRPIEKLMGDTTLLRGLRPQDFADARFGEPTVKDILAELEKPGRDPRAEFRAPRFQEGIETLEDLGPDMVLEGVVTNVTHFGAFVDIGVHQDGLVHVSAMSDRFVRDPRELVKPGDIVKVKVLDVDLKRKRVALSMRLSDSAAGTAAETDRPARPRPPSPQKPPKRSPGTGTAMADAFRRLERDEGGAPSDKSRSR